MLNIVIPMAGEGSRFRQAGFEKPKPFIDVNGSPMIERVMENLSQENSQFILVGRKSHYELELTTIKKLESKYKFQFVFVEQLTEGSASTILLAKNLIANDRPLLIANSDQLIDYQLQHFLKDAEDRSLDGSILTFRDETMNPKWSFAKLDKDNLVSEVQEKKPISEFATVGIYWFKSGQFFVDSANDMISRNFRVNNEFYTCPVYNFLIESGKKIGIHNIDVNKIHGLGTPEDLQIYLNKTQVTE